MSSRRIPVVLVAALAASVFWSACGGEDDPDCRPSAELCNGLDDDCDGQTDDGFDVGAACTEGLGACAATGQKVCATGGAATRCTAEPGAPTAELCNQVDDDCDGQTDQEVAGCCVPSATRPCGADVGACRAGLETCDAAGAWGACLLAGAPVILPGTQPEACSGQDDDCDGQTDEEFDVGAACTAGVGACAATGQKVCAAGGAATECAAVAGEPSIESCDGIDEDCDGQTDEQLSAPPCASQTGVCAGSRASCGGDAGWLACGVDEYGVQYEPVETSCDGLDNDCDGATDEEVVPPAPVCSIANVHGSCTGTWSCGGAGGWSCAGPTPAAELCNSLDDDCDGQTDEGFPVGASCQAGVGVCVGTGTFACKADATGVQCGAVPAWGNASTEVCDGLDNDCDGTTDEDPVIPVCEKQQGVCAGARKLAALCQSGTWAACTTEAYLAHSAAFEPSELICDGLDNDCDGTTDEGFPVGGECTAGVGLCARTGILACVPGGGGAQCTAVAGEPQLEACANSLDDDCDGQTDEAPCS